MASNMSSLIKENWENREFIEIISHGLNQLTDFLTDIEKNTQYKLAALNEKLSIIEKNLSIIECRTLSVINGGEVTNTGNTQNVLFQGTNTVVEGGGQAPPPPPAAANAPPPPPPPGAGAPAAPPPPAAGAAAPPPPPPPPM